MVEKYILLLLPVALAAAMLVLWRQLQQTRRYCRQLNTAIQRMERDIQQNRYGIAMLRQKNIGTEKDETAIEDDKLMDMAFSHVDLDPDADIDEPTTGETATGNPSAVEVGNMRPGQVLQFLKKAIKNNEISVSLQPIVRLPARTTSFYEVFARIKVGDQGYISAGKFIAVARDNNLMSAIDNLLLLRCLQLVKQAATKDAATSFFVNISAATLTNKTYVSDLVSFLSANPRLSSRLIFEITQAESIKTTPAMRQVIEALSLLGCRFSMDQITILGLDVDRLMDQNVNFVKLDANLILKEMQEIDKRNRLKKLKNFLESSGITVIVEKIEHERQLLGLVDLYIDYAQGYLFGRPEAVNLAAA